MTSDSSTSHASGEGASDLDEQHGQVLLATASLVRRLTRLADRYDRLPTPGDRAQAAVRRRNIALLRETAVAGTRLIARSAAPVEEPTQVPAVAPAALREAGARARDLRAARRDELAEARDLRASLRDREADSADRDRGFAFRFLSAGDRDDAAGDRVHAQSDRHAARRERMRELSWWGAHGPPVGRTVMDHLDAAAAVHQAQGLLMAGSGIDAAEAFEALLLASQQQGVPLGEFAIQAVQEARRTSGGATSGHE